jgi:cell division protein FtsB
MVVRLTKERDALKVENKELVEENLELKRRCSDLWKELTEERAKSDL